MPPLEGLEKSVAINQMEQNNEINHNNFKSNKLTIAKF